MGGADGGFRELAEMTEKTLRDLSRLADSSTELDRARVWVHDAKAPAGYRPIGDNEPGPDEMIREWVAIVRRHMTAALDAVERGDADAAALQAWQAGSSLAHALPGIAGDSTAQAVQVGLETRTQRRDFARRGREKQSAGADDRQQRVEDAARKLRADHPYSNKHSSRWLAKEVARQLDLKLGTVRDDLAALDIR